MARVKNYDKKLANAGMDPLLVITMKNLHMDFELTSTGHVEVIPDHIRDLASEKEDHISVAIRVLIEATNPKVNLHGTITSQTPDFMSISLWDQNSIVNGVITNNHGHIYVNAFVDALQRKLGQNHTADNSTNLKTTIVGFRPLKEALMSISREETSPRVTFEISTYLRAAENLDARYKAHTKTALPRPV